MREIHTFVTSEMTKLSEYRSVKGMILATGVVDISSILNVFEELEDDKKIEIFYHLDLFVDLFVFKKRAFLSKRRAKMYSPKTPQNIVPRFKPPTRRKPAFFIFTSTLLLDPLSVRCIGDDCSP